jgi:NAD(P)-dependent dehydrogenase (short-subunit alcohol dehydrogenase family)
MNLQNKVAIVTGSSKGIGMHIARNLAGAGARVVINYASDQTAADRVVAEIHSAGGESIAVRANVGNSAEVKALFDAAIARFGKVDLLINNAGIAIYKFIKETTDDDFDRIFDINVKGVFLTLREAATRLADGGRIINLSSSVTRLMMPAYGSYSATKAAVEQAKPKKPSNGWHQWPPLGASANRRILLASCYSWSATRRPGLLPRIWASMAVSLNPSHAPGSAYSVILNES